MSPYQAISLYVHIPFCRAKCAYCDFNSYAGLEELHPRYVWALEQEARWFAARYPLKAATLYVGGGTPTSLSFPLLARTLEVCLRLFPPVEGVEVTVEANPGTVDEAYLRGLRELGTTRLSLGVQSFHDEELRLLGRIHTASEAVEAFRLARGAGFEVINLDLIYGLPGQALARWEETLRKALALRPEHLSLYALTLEEHTPLAQSIARGELPPLDDDLAAEMYERAEEILAEAGYLHYEISNWARGKAHRCRHNLTYWHNRPYIGLGAGAHSFFRGRRWHNVLSPHEYIRRMGSPGSEELPPAVEAWEEIDEGTEMAETMILGLRLLEEGVRFDEFKRRFGRELGEVYKEELRELEEWGLMEVSAGRVRLTRRGRLLGNEVFRRFV